MRAIGIFLVVVLGAGCSADVRAPQPITRLDPAVDPSPTLSRAGSVFYVARSGSDRHSGARNRPWATIERALRAARAGDKIVVRQGTYQGARFRHSGTKDAPIVLTARGLVKLRGGATYGLSLSGVNHVIIEGFNIKGFRAGITLSGSSDVVIRRSTLTKNADAGVQIWRSSRIRVFRNRLLDLGSTQYQDYGVNTYYSSSVVVRGNRFRGRHNQALSFKRRTLRSSAIGNVFEGCLYTCLYVGQNDDDGDGDMTSYLLDVRDNRFRPLARSGSHPAQLCRTPLAVRNVRSAVIEDNVIHPRCVQRVDRIGSPQRSGRARGDITIRHNVVRVW